MERENTNRTDELQKLVDTWSAMNRFSFYTGVQRGIMSSLNTICLRFGGISFEDYTKAAFKPQLNQMFTTAQAIQLLAGLLKSVDDLVNAAMVDAQAEIKSQEGKNDNAGLQTTTESPKVVV